MPVTGRVIQLSTPDPSDLHIDAPLTNISVAYRNSTYIADAVVPRVIVAKDSGKYFKYDQGDWMRVEASEPRAPATVGPIGGYTVSTDSYSVDTWSMAMDVPDEARRIADAPLNPLRGAAAYCADQIRLKIEDLVSTLLTTTGNYATGHSTTLSGTSQWSDSTSSPIEAIAAQLDTIAGKIGRRPNVFWCGRPVWTELKNHVDVLERIKYSETGVATTELFARLIEVDRVVVGDAVKNTAADGATASYSRLWGKNAGLLWVPPTPGLMTASFAYQFVLRGVDFVTERFRLSTGENADRVRTMTALDLKVVDSRAGYLWKSAVA